MLNTNNTLKLSVAALSLVLVTDVFASNSDNESSHDDLAAVPTTAAAVPSTTVAAGPEVVPVLQLAPAELQPPVLVPQTPLGRLCARFIGNAAVVYVGKKIGVPYPDQRPITEQEKQAQDQAAQEAKVAEEERHENLIRLVANGYGLDYDNLSVFIKKDLKAAHEINGLGPFCQRLIDEKAGKTPTLMAIKDRKGSSSSDEEKVQTSVQVAPQPKTSIGIFTSYLIGSRATVAIGKSIFGMTYEPDQTEAPKVVPVPQELTLAEKMMLRKFAALSEEKRKRLLDAIDDGSLAKLIEGGNQVMEVTNVTNNNNAPIIEPSVPVEDFAPPAAPVYTGPPVGANNQDANNQSKPQSSLSLADQLAMAKLKKTENSNNGQQETKSDSDENLSSLAAAILARRGAIEEAPVETDDQDW